MIASQARDLAASMPDHAIFRKPLVELAWSDIEEIVRSQLEEGALLDFKRTLQAKDGQLDPWQRGQDRIGDHAKRELAIAAVSFANAYGGMVVVGIDETADRPSRAAGFADPLVRSCVECGERVRDSLLSLIDPPIRTLEVRGIPKPDGEGEGVFIVRTGSSDQAPHGVGRPPEGYVRRGYSSEPLMMRDLHSMFWEVRTRRERVAERLAEASRELNALATRHQELGIEMENGTRLEPNLPCLYFRVTVIPDQPLGLKGIAESLYRTPPDRPRVRDLRGNELSSALGSGPFHYRFRPRAHGAIVEGQTYSTCAIGDDGSIKVAGISPGRSPGADPYNGHPPERYTATVAQVLLLAELLRISVGRSDVGLVVECELLHDGSARGLKGGTYEAEEGIPETRVRIGPFTLGARAAIPLVFAELEREIWFGLGLVHPRPLELDWERAFLGLGR